MLEHPKYESESQRFDSCWEHLEFFSKYTYTGTSQTEKKKTVLKPAIFIYITAQELVCSPTGYARLCKKKNEMVTINYNYLTASNIIFAEGLAVGVGFGAIGKTASATFENARYMYCMLSLLNWIILSNA